MCRTAHAILSVAICGIQMLVRVFMTFILMLENIFRLILQTLYNFLSFMLQMASLIPICVVFLLTTRLKCFMCGGGGPCPVNRGGGCDCLMSLAAIVLIFFIFRAVGLMDKIFYKIGYVQAPPVLDKFEPTPGDVTECSRDENGLSAQNTTELESNTNELESNTNELESNTNELESNTNELESNTNELESNTNVLTTSVTDYDLRTGFTNGPATLDNNDIEISEASDVFRSTAQYTTANDGQRDETDTIIKVEYELKDTEIEPMITEIYFINDNATEQSDTVTELLTVNVASNEISTLHFNSKIERSISEAKSYNSDTAHVLHSDGIASSSNPSVTSSTPKNMLNDCDQTNIILADADEDDATKTNVLNNAQFIDVPGATYTIPQTSGTELAAAENDGLKYGTEIDCRDVDGDTEGNLQILEETMYPVSQAKKRRELKPQDRQRSSLANAVLEEGSLRPILVTESQNELRELTETMSTIEEKSLQTLLQLFEYVTYYA